jgi:predicted nucleotidyltransferase
MTNVFGLKEKTIQKIHAVFAKYPCVDKVIIYGSRATGNYKNGSDIDLTFVGNTISDQDMANIYVELDDLLTPYSFDLSLYAQIENPDLIDHIDRVGKIFYQQKQ